MNRLFRDSSAPQNWESEIKAWRQELAAHGHEMSQYERNVISREIKKRQEELIPVVGARVIGEFKEAIAKYQDSKKAIEIERQKEVNRFDSQKFNTELQAITARINLAQATDIDPVRGDVPASKRLAAIYEESMLSNDLHKQRAAIEVFKSIEAKKPAVRGPVNQLRRTAEAAEVQLRTTEGLQQARQAEAAAFAELHARHENLNKVSETLGTGSIKEIYNTSPFAKAARMIHQDKTTGEITIYNEDDPEVTGVYFKPQSETMGGI